MTLDLEQIKAAARAAAPGPWHANYMRNLDAKTVIELVERLERAEAALAGVRDAREQFKRDLYKCPPLDRSTKAQREGLSIAHGNILGALSNLDLPNYGTLAGVRHD